MSTLNAYLAQYFFAKSQLANACEVSEHTIDRLLAARLIPAPSYRVQSSRIDSYVFGEMSAPGAANGDYFHRDTTVWVQRAMRVSARHPDTVACHQLRERFDAGFRSALAKLDRSLWRVKDSFADDGSWIAGGYGARFESVWDHFLQGTFGVCVAHPVSEHAIACKEVLQEKLSALTANGTRHHFSPEERPELIKTIDAYAAATMPFSPIDYPRSSRKRLVDDIRQALLSNAGRA